MQIYIIFTCENLYERKKNFNSIDFEVICVFVNQSFNKLRNFKEIYGCIFC